MLLEMWQEDVHRNTLHVNSYFSQEEIGAVVIGENTLLK